VHRGPGALLSGFQTNWIGWLSFWTFFFICFPVFENLYALPPMSRGEPYVPFLVTLSPAPHPSVSFFSPFCPPTQVRGSCPRYVRLLRRLLLSLLHSIFIPCSFVHPASASLYFSRFPFFSYYQSFVTFFCSAKMKMSFFFLTSRPPFSFDTMPDFHLPEDFLHPPYIMDRGPHPSLWRAPSFFSLYFSCRLVP